jgi:XTP/dITP diphosphohydrolase
MELCFATNNLHKLQEVKSILGNSYSILSLAEIGCHEELAEEQDTIPGNSFQKAEYVFKKYKIACFADDSGLEIAALNGRPGVDSAHYAGPQRSFNDNMNLVLSNLENAENREAQFRTVITLITPTANKQFEGILKGVILKEKRGTGGFGYDPIFLPTGFSKTLAEMSMEEKNKISHRALATQKLIEFLLSQK